MLTRTTKESKPRTPAAMAACICGLSLGFASFASTAGAQDDNDGEYMEWEADEGLHEEEWYDPSDWFDDDFDGIDGPDTDYEYDDEYGWTDYDYDGEYYTAYNDEYYDSDWWYDSDRQLYNHGYYDGYYDGYANHGDTYQSMQDQSKDEKSNRNLASNRYNTGYQSGFEDGQHDKESNYTADWTYYIYAFPVGDQQAAQTQKEREKDTARKRGDRAADARTRDMDAKMAARDVHDQQDRIRGTVERVEQLRKDRLAENAKDNTVLRLTLENGKQVVVDLGPNAKNNVIDEGDRVTVVGKRIQRDGRTVLDATRLSINDQLMWNTQGFGEPQRVERDSG